MPRTVCVYHSADLDGQCSGAIVNRSYPLGVELVGYNYGEQVLWDVLDGRDVIMVDVSFQPFSEMVELRKRTTSLTWIDHHKTAINEAASQGFDPPGLREVGQAACELCWSYYFPASPMPEAVRLLGRYDVWDHSDPAALPFQYGAQLHIHSVEDEIWGALLSGDHSKEGEIVRDGRLIIRYQDGQNDKQARAKAFEVTLDGLRTIACNHGPTNSQLFDTVYDPSRHDAMMPFYYSNKGHWTVSLYSTKPEIDCGEVAKSRGGGGHKGAAGFQCNVLPFLIP